MQSDKSKLKKMCSMHVNFPISPFEPPESKHFTGIIFDTNWSQLWQDVAATLNAKHARQI